MPQNNISDMLRGLRPAPATLPPPHRRSHQPSNVMTSPSGSENSTRTTRGRKRDYHQLHNYGLQGREESPSPRLPTPNKRVRSLGSFGQQKSKEKPPNRPNPPIILESQDSVMIEEEQESEAKDLKRAWWWKYYNVVVLDTTWERGRGTKRATVKDEEYKCRFYSKCRFKKLASVLKCSTSAMSSHIEKKHNIHENTASE